MKMLFDIRKDIKNSMDAKVESILDDLDEVNDIMVDNIKHTMVNVVQLEELDDKVRNTIELSNTLSKKSKILILREYWKNKKEYIFAGFVICIVLISLVIGIIFSVMNLNG
jgi:hypothetical protein